MIKLFRLETILVYCHDNISHMVAHPCIFRSIQDLKSVKYTLAMSE